MLATFDNDSKLKTVKPKPCDNENLLSKMLQLDRHAMTVLQFLNKAMKSPGRKHELQHPKRDRQSSITRF